MIKMNKKVKKNNATFGWMGRIFTRAGTGREHAIALNKDSTIIVSQAFPLKLAASTSQQVLSACQIACQGAAIKTTARAIVANPVVNVDLALGNGPLNRVFGVHVRITDSLLNFKTGTYLIQLLDGANVMSEVTVLVDRGQVDVVLLAISNNGGQASIPGASQPIVRFLAAGSDFVPASTALFAESLNMRDIGNISGNIAGSFSTQ